VGEKKTTMETLDDPLPTPVLRAELTAIYEKAERSTSIKWGKKMAKLRAQDIDLILASGFIGSVFTVAFMAGILVIVK